MGGVTVAKQSVLRWFPLIPLLEGDKSYLNTLKVSIFISTSPTKDPFSEFPRHLLLELNAN